jgi:hypothetical protein
MLEVLDKRLPDKEYNQWTFFDLIELIDVRVYKSKSGESKAEISRTACRLASSWTVKEIQDWLLAYNRNYMPKESFQLYLKSNFYRNQALPHIFIDYCEHLERKKFSFEELTQLTKNSPQIEHILSQTPKFSPRSLGFSNQEDFIEFEHTLGNLTLLEKKINQAVQNRNPRDKVSYYYKSKFIITKVLSTRIAKQKRFTKADIRQRTQELTEYCSNRWWC